MVDGVPPLRNTDRCVTWLTSNPGFYRPRDVAAATGLTNHQAAVALRYLWECGRIERKEARREGYTRAIGFYGTTDGNVKPQSRIPAWRNAQRGDAVVYVLTPPPSKETK